MTITDRTSNSLMIELVEPTLQPFEWDPPGDYHYYELHTSRSPDGRYSLVVSDIDAETRVVGGLQPSAVYYLALLVCDGFGCDQEMAAATTESDGPVSAPTVPTGFRGEKIVMPSHPDTAKLTWDAVEGATYYELWKGADPGASFEMLVQISAPLEAQSFDIAPNRKFFGEFSLTSWKVRACNKAGCPLFAEPVTIQ